MTSSRYNIEGKNALHIAAALRTVGFRVQCKTDKNMASAGKTETRWFVTHACQDAIDCIKGKAKTPAKQAVQERYNACLSAIVTRCNLPVWIQSGGNWYDVAGWRCPDFMRFQETPCAAVPLHLLDFIACAITVGHFPRPYLTKSNLPSLLVTAASGTTLTQLGEAAKEIQSRRDGNVAKAFTLPGHSPDEHPFMYAFEALQHARNCADEQKVAAGNPTGMFKGQGGRTALVSESILAGDTNSERLLTLHLTGQL